MSDKAEKSFFFKKDVPVCKSKTYFLGWVMGWGDKGFTTLKTDLSPTFYIHADVGLVFSLLGLRQGFYDFDNRQQYEADDSDRRYQPPCDKTIKMTCAQQRLRSAWASTQSDQSFHWALNR